MTNSEALQLSKGDRVMYRGKSCRVLSVKKIREESPNVEVTIQKYGYCINGVNPRLLETK